MSLNKKVGVLAGAASAMVAGVCYGGSTPDTDARIAALESQIAQLRNDSASWLNAEQTRALVRETLADSETRASLLQNGGTAGYREGHGFFLSNEDGSFDVNIGIKSQFRGIYNDKDSADQSTFGWENSRTRLTFDGHAGNPDLTYFIQGDFEVNGGAFVLLDAYGNWALGNGWDWGWGQAKAPFLHETLGGEFQTLAVDKSYVEAWFGAGYTQGTWLHYANDTMDFWVSFNDGAMISPTGLNAGNLNTPFNTDGTEWAFTARAEAVLAGSKAQFNDYTSWSTDETGFLLGGAIHWQDGEYGTGGEEVQSFSWTVDASAEFGAANLAGYIVGLSTDPNATGATDYDQWGIVVQGGYHIVPDKFEIFGRWEWMDLDNVVAEDNINLLTFGFNYYFGRQHGWKWTTDVVYALDSIPVGASNLGLLADAAGEDNQWALRSQMQVAIP